MEICGNDLAERLRRRLTGAAGVAVMGIGYELGSDDGAGLAVAERLRKARPDLPVFLTGSAPENYTGPVVKARPSHVIFVDAAEFDAAPGAVALIDRGEISGAKFSTHTLPLSLIMEYFQRRIGAESFALGIQPKQEGFGEGLSPEVEAAVLAVTGALKLALAGE